MLGRTAAASHTDAFNHCESPSMHLAVFFGDPLLAGQAYNAAVEERDAECSACSSSDGHGHGGFGGTHDWAAGSHG